MSWLADPIRWILISGVLGLTCLPISATLFAKFADRGYPFARTIGMLLLSYIIYIAATPISYYQPFQAFRDTTLFTALDALSLPFVPASLLLIIVGLIIVQLIIAKYIFKFDVRPQVILQWYRSILGNKLVIAEEGLFIASFLALSYIRSQEPSIHGLEKFMDFGFINSILRSTHFPPLDMWYGPDAQAPNGYPINYYYFGHLGTAVMIRLTNLPSQIGYNLMLAFIFAQSMSASFSLCLNLIGSALPRVKKAAQYTVTWFSLVSASIGALLLNLGGNMHTIYLFTSGYSGDSPTPFWQILTGFQPDQYWYPNATRFIPFTIHEFPAYSYVVADLHGHVLDIPFVLLTLAFILIFFQHIRTNAARKKMIKIPMIGAMQSLPAQLSRHIKKSISTHKAKTLGYYGLFGFMLAVHYMTNAFDGPIYFLVLVGIFLMLFGFSRRLVEGVILTGVSFVIFSFVFTHHFEPFASGIGVNCASQWVIPGRYGPFVVEADKCQISAAWMMFVLWGFFIIAFFTFLMSWYAQKKKSFSKAPYNHLLVLALFGISFFFLFIPEFFYAKDIYPQHFRANTMFKLGYQAFIMLSIGSAYALFWLSTLPWRYKYVLKSLFAAALIFPLLFSFYSFSSYYGDMKRAPNLDGMAWLKRDLPASYEIVQYLNTHVSGQPVVLEAQGDSYTDYERISANTGLPTVAGWWVHEWLWRDDADAVGIRIPDVEQIYQSNDLGLTIALLRKYRVEYVVIDQLERAKYPEIAEEKFERLGEKIFESKDGFGALYKVNIN